MKQQQQRDITLDEAAEKLNISLFYLSKLFRKNTGMRFTEYPAQVRLEHTKETALKIITILRAVVLLRGKRTAPPDEPEGLYYGNSCNI